MSSGFPRWPTGMVFANSLLKLRTSSSDIPHLPSRGVSVPPGATVGDMVARVQAAGGAERLPPRPLVAVNQAYASYDHVLVAGDEIALIPPVAGG